MNGVEISAADAGITVAANGAASFTTLTAVYQSLNVGQNANVEVVYRAPDGQLSDTGTLKFTVQGANDAASISGTDAGTVTEDGAEDADAATVETVSGTLTVSTRTPGRRSSSRLRLAIW